VGGHIIGVKKFKQKGAFRFVGCANIITGGTSGGQVLFTNGNELVLLTIKNSPAAKPKPSQSSSALKKKTLETKMNRQHIHEGISSHTQEKQTDKLLEEKRAKMNIDGLSEEEMVQLALAMSMSNT
jgi:hypothetical protein